PNTCGPASCIAPYPMRVTVRSSARVYVPPGSVVSVMGSPLFQYASRSRRDTRHGPPATRHREGTGEPEDRRYHPRRPSHTDTKNRPSIRSVADELTPTREL